jgi:hypothetical protein
MPPTDHLTLPTSTTSTESFSTPGGNTIRPLNGDNWAEWEQAIGGLAMQWGLDDHLTSDEYKVGDKTNRKVVGLIYSKMEPSQRAFFGYPTFTSVQAVTAKTLWDKISKHYTKMSLQLMLTYTIELDEPYVNGQKMETFLTRKRDIINKLSAAGLRQPEPLLCLRVLNCLPPSWHTLRSILVNNAVVTAPSTPDGEMTSTMTFQTLSASLLAEEVQRASDERTAATTQSELSALYSRSHQPTDGQWKDSRTCHWCQKKGHIEANCNSKRDGKPRVAPRVQSANVVSSPSPYTTEVQSPTPPPSTDAWCFTVTDDSTFRPSEWWLDSGASTHFCCQSELIRDLNEHDSTVTVGDGRVVSIRGTGTVTIDMLTPGHVAGRRPKPHTFTPVSYAPGLNVNLLSVSALSKASISVHFHDGRALLRQGGRCIGYALLQAKNSLYRIVTPTTADGHMALIAAGTESIGAPIDVWHQRMGHRHHKAISQLFADKLTADGHQLRNTVAPSDQSLLTHCEPCVMGKQHREPVPLKADPVSRATVPLFRVWVDLFGPTETPALDGGRYMMLIVDDYSRYTVGVSLPTKDGAFAAFQHYVAMAENLHGRKVCWVRSDNGGEFISTAFSTWLRERGTQRERTVPYTPSQNGVVERMNRTVMEAARAVLTAAHLPKSFWALAALSAVYTGNRCPTTSLDKKTPYQAWHGKKPHIGHMRIFGCLAYVHVRKGARTKLDVKSQPCTFVGYSSDSRGYKLWNGNKLIESKDVHFVEELRGYTYQSAGEAAAGEDASFASANPFVELNEGQPTAPTGKRVGELRRLEDKMTPGPRDLAPSAVGQSISNPTGPPTTRSRSHHHVSPTVEAQLALAVSTISTANNSVRDISRDEPRTLREAMSSPYSTQWRRATDAEMESLLKAGTYTLVPLPDGANLIGCKWVLKVKRGADGSIIKYKGRLVAKGYAQRYGVDYDETYAPVARYPSIRLLIALAAHYGWELHQMDVKSAYLNGELDTPIYMTQPEGYVVAGKEDHVCLLKKSLYGLKQAGRTWHHKIDIALKDRGFTALEADHCVYIRRIALSVIIIALYVDDLLIASSQLAELSQFKADLTAQFEMEDLGEAAFLLGIDIKRSRNDHSISIGQSAYINTLLQRHGLADCKPASTPMDRDSVSQLIKSAADYQASAETIRDYQTMIGGLMFAMISTRPDIAFAVTTLAQFASNPSDAHIKAVRRVFHYLRGTADLRITYTGKQTASTQPQLLGYCDSDWGQSHDRRSITGYVFLLCGGAISWQSKKQKTVALSTVEAEYMAATHATKEAIWWRAHMQGLGYDVSAATTLLSDSQGCIALAKNPDQHSRTKHIDIQYHFIRQHVIDGIVSLTFVGTTDMAADILTKSLDKQRHENGVRMLGM